MATLPPEVTTAAATKDYEKALKACRKFSEKQQEVSVCSAECAECAKPSRWSIIKIGVCVACCFQQCVSVTSLCLYRGVPSNHPSSMQNTLTRGNE